MKKWLVRSVDKESVDNIIKKTDLARLTAEVMSARGYNDIESLADFFDISELSDPFLLKDMDKAAKAIEEAVSDNEIICIYGDYDCDGVTSAAILYDYLMNIGANVICYIPERSEGYGLNIKAIDEIRQSDASLIVTVDNGITAFDEADYIDSLGMKLVITDHHQPSDKLPNALAVVDPYRKDCGSPYKNLAGVGVTLKLLCALDGGNYDAVLEQYADICAIGTIADVVPLNGENRTIVKTGLSLLKNTDNQGLLSLMERCGADPQHMTSTSVAFTISPRINAAGRFGSAMTALDMLTAEDDVQAEENVSELCRLNEIRKSAESRIMEQIRTMFDNNPGLSHKRVIVISGRGWNHGVIGIVAARLLEIYERPVVVISEDEGGTARGSARSISGFNIFKCFEFCKELLIKYGGHECAGGLTVASENIELLDDMIQEYARLYHPKMPKYTLTADKLLKGSDISERNISDLCRIEPFGAENTEPLFAISGAKIISVTPLKNGEHTKLEVEFEGKRLSALLFRHKTALIGIGANDSVDLMGTLGINEFKGVRSFTMNVQDYRLHGIKQDRYFQALDAYEAFVRGEELPSEVLKKGRPERSELVSIYKYIASLNSRISFENLYARLQSESLNYFKLMVSLDAFAETGLICKENSSKTVYANVPDKRVDIAVSQTLRSLDEKISAASSVENGEIYV